MSEIEKKLRCRLGLHKWLTDNATIEVPRLNMKYMRPEHGNPRSIVARHKFCVYCGKEKTVTKLI